MPYSDNSQPIEGALRVWWIPQVPGKPFYRAVADLPQALLLIEALAYYDMFQFENQIKPDYCNAGGVEILRNGEWEDWYADDGNDFDEWARQQIAKDGKDNPWVLINVFGRFPPASLNSLIGPEAVSDCIKQIWRLWEHV